MNAQTALPVPTAPAAPPRAESRGAHVPRHVRFFVTAGPMIARTAIPAVKVGQPAGVMLTALNRRTTPVLKGEVFHLSANAIVQDGAEDQDVYIARIQIPVCELDPGPGFAPVPGMPAQVMVQTAERTFLQYIMKPVTDAVQRAIWEISRGHRLFLFRKQSGCHRAMLPKTAPLSRAFGRRAHPRHPRKAVSQDEGTWKDGGGCARPRTCTARPAATSGWSVR